MKPGQFLLLIIIFVIAVLGAGHFVAPEGSGKTAVPAMLDFVERESAFERVVEAGTLRCGYVAWAPYYIVDANTGERSGMNVEIMEAIGRELGLKIEWAEEVGWGNLIEGLKTGRYDAVCTGAWPDAAKMKHALMTNPFAFSQLRAYVRRNDARFDGNLEAINDPKVRIVVVDGGSSEGIARNRFPKATIVGVPPLSSEAEWFLYVQQNKADVIITDASETQKFMAANPGVLKAVANVPQVSIMPLQLTVDQNETALRERLDAALALLNDNGAIRRIADKYAKDYLYPAPRHTR